MSSQFPISSPCPFEGTKDLGATHFIVDIPQGSCLVIKVLKRNRTFRTKSYNSVLQ
jgi:hypothetical protein